MPEGRSDPNFDQYAVNLDPLECVTDLLSCEDSRCAPVVQLAQHGAGVGEGIPTLRVPTGPLALVGES